MKKQNRIEEKVIQLVGIHQEDNQLYLTEEGKSFLQNIDKPISVVTIAGLYRTGKSYLVNELISKLHEDGSLEQKKFLVGNTVQSCTKGLNVWAIPFEANSSGQKFYYIVVDSEGIGSMEQQQNYDMNLLMLVFLISSTVIYNSIGAIDQQSLDQLRVIVNLRKSFGQQQSITQPRFVWVLRDFALQLVNKKGQTMSPNQYLQDCLQLASSSSKQATKKNEIRQAIKQSLPNRECHTLVRPTINQQDLSNLHLVPKRKLRKEFVEQVDDLFESVFTNQLKDVKHLNEENNLVDGSGLAKMIEYYLSEINCNKVPEVRSVWELIQSTRLDELMEQCQNQLKTQTLRIDLPLPQQQLKQRLNQIQNRIFTYFESQLPPNDIQTYKKFSQHFVRLTSKLNTKIRKASQDIRKKKTFKQVRDKINQEIEFDRIDPCSIGEVREVIQGLELKNLNDPQIYDYVVNTVLDVLQIAQQKTLNIKDKLDQYERNIKETDIEQNYKQQQNLKLKQNYHEALKEISYLKSSHIENEKDLAIKKQQLSLLEEKFFNLTSEKIERQEELRRKIEELNQKLRKRNQQSNESMKHLRQQNQSLIFQLEETKKNLNQKFSEQRRESIFQDKIKQSWDRFEEERTYFKKQLQKFKQLYFQAEERVRGLVEKQQNLESLLKRQKQIFAKKQKQFCDQLKWMKQNYSKTKDAYNQSINTRMESQRILQDVTSGSKKRNSLLSQNSRNQNNLKMSASQKCIIQELTSTIQTLKQQKKSHLHQISVLSANFQKNQSQLEKLKQFYQQKIDTIEQHTNMLEESNQAEKERFYTCLKELQDSKEAERQMYEESIMRLLNNMEGLEPVLKGKNKVLEGSRNMQAVSQQKSRKTFY